MYRMRRAPMTVNLAGLDEALRQALGQAYLGMSQDGRGLSIYLQDAEAQTLANTVIDAHDPVLLTPQQAITRAHQLALRDARLQNPVGVDASLLNDSNPTIQTLARKIAWLEWEIRDLRGNSL